MLEPNNCNLCSIIIIVYKIRNRYLTCLLLRAYMNENKINLMNWGDTSVQSISEIEI